MSERKINHHTKPSQGGDSWWPSTDSAIEARGNRLWKPLKAAGAAAVAGAVLAAGSTINARHWENAEVKHLDDVTSISFNDTYASGTRSANPVIRSKPGVGVFDLPFVTKIATLNPEVVIETPNGVDKICAEGDTFRDEITGQENQRCWYAVDASETIDSVRHADPAAAEELLKASGLDGTVYVASDFTVISSDVV